MNEIRRAACTISYRLLRTDPTPTPTSSSLILIPARFELVYVNIPPAPNTPSRTLNAAVWFLGAPIVSPQRVLYSQHNGNSNNNNKNEVCYRSASLAGPPFPVLPPVCIQQGKKRGPHQHTNTRVRPASPEGCLRMPTRPKLRARTASPTKVPLPTPPSPPHILVENKAAALRASVRE